MKLSDSLITSLETLARQKDCDIRFGERESLSGWSWTFYYRRDWVEERRSSYGEIYLVPRYDTHMIFSVAIPYDKATGKELPGDHPAILAAYEKFKKKAEVVRQKFEELRQAQAAKTLS